MFLVLASTFCKILYTAIYWTYPFARTKSRSSINSSITRILRLPIPLFLSTANLYTPFPVLLFQDFPTRGRCFVQVWRLTAYREYYVDILQPNTQKKNKPTHDPLLQRLAAQYLASTDSNTHPIPTAPLSYEKRVTPTSRSIFANANMTLQMQT